MIDVIFAFGKGLVDAPWWVTLVWPTIWALIKVSLVLMLVLLVRVVFFMLFFMVCFIGLRVASGCGHRVR